MTLGEIRRLSKALREEIPETAAILRLATMEAADCLEEYSGLGQDLTAGLRSSARLLSSAEEASREVPRQVVSAVRGPLGQKTIGFLEARLQESARLRHSHALLRCVGGGPSAPGGGGGLEGGAVTGRPPPCPGATALAGGPRSGRGWRGGRWRRPAWPWAWPRTSPARPRWLGARERPSGARS